LAAVSPCAAWAAGASGFKGKAVLLWWNGTRWKANWPRPIRHRGGQHRLRPVRASADLLLRQRGLLAASA